MSLLCGHSARFSETWPTSGWMRGGRCYPLPPSAPPTAGSGCSSSPGLPTPKARDAKGPDAKREDLGHAVTLLKTPTSNLGVIGGSQHPDKRRQGGHGPNLSDEVEHLLFPTPKASDGTHGGPNSRGSKGDLTLPSAAAQLLPTPRASDTGTPGRKPGAGFRPPLSAVVLPIWEQDSSD
ncbi:MULTISPECIES: hypothetical protein [unclassified Kitasatospora]|uniref:hypothetical protein n=1 Tax=Kitasatospora sp. MBT63 TaxID=1444768 RepID=UPI001E2F77BD|nr:MULTISPECIES: hypothetical protein [unclassified Kitasatospora]